MSKFYDVRLAIGDLVLAGVRVEARPYKNSIALYCLTLNEMICYCYRDGTTYKVKQEIIEDWIDEQN